MESRLERIQGVTAQLVTGLRHRHNRKALKKRVMYPLQRWRVRAGLRIACQIFTCLDLLFTQPSPEEWSPHNVVSVYIVKGHVVNICKENYGRCFPATVNTSTPLPKLYLPPYVHNNSFIYRT